MNYAVSIIVPVYNVEKYLAQCLESLVLQTLDSIEIIIVNDGSPDNSQSIINHYQTLYPSKIFPFKKPNGGLGDARNFGLSKANGEYIGFIDSDDWVEPNMFKVLYQKAIEEQSKLVLCDLEYVWEDGQSSQHMSGYKPELRKSINKVVFLAPLFAWNKLYHRSLFETNNLRFPKGLWYEDIPVTVPIFALAKKISYVPETFVHYRQRSTSIMGTSNSNKLQDIFTVLELVRVYFLDHNLLFDYKDEIEYLYVEHLILYGGFRFMRSDNGMELMRRSFEIINSHFPNWQKNPYLSTLKFTYIIYLKCIQIWMVPILMKLLNRQGRK